MAGKGTRILSLTDVVILGKGLKSQWYQLWKRHGHFFLRIDPSWSSNSPRPSGCLDLVPFALDTETHEQRGLAAAIAELAQARAVFYPHSFSQRLTQSSVFLRDTWDAKMGMIRVSRVWAAWMDRGTRARKGKGNVKIMCRNIWAIWFQKLLLQE